MDVLASAAATIIEPGLRKEQYRSEIETRLSPVLAGGGPVVVLQPIVDLATGERVGAEALSRFPAEWHKAPDVVFAEAHAIGLGDRLELLALQRAAADLDSVPGYVSMNDVGAGFSSLRHIVVTSPDVIKMAGSIISGVDTDPVLAKLARSLVEFAHSIDVRVVAEGVETAAEHAVLRALDVDLGQGWLFGRPTPAADLDVPDRALIA
jgi:EAL domain-containing protein (putative c-di-GMP-specific phosphodiesterase class I)